MAVLIAGCGRFGYDLLPSNDDADASGGVDGGSASGGAAGGDGTGGASNAGAGTGGADAGGRAGMGPGGAGGLTSVDGGMSPPVDAGSSGTAGTASGGGSALDAGPTPTCSDSLQNQDETGVDCGGTTCAPCPTCSDSLQNQDETGVDCGGTTCAPCPTCSDSLQNQDETDVDCGGTACAPCPCTFGAPQVLGTPNNFGSVWSPTLSSDGLTMYLSLTSSGLNERVAVTTRPSRGNNFGNVSALPSPVNTSADGTPELSADGLSLYFYSQGFGGVGARDLYVATRANTSSGFNTVRELTTVNSSQRDDRPWVSPDELTLYFSSQRAALSDDLWRATRSSRSDAFGTPVAVTELNSTGNDAGIFLTADGLVALFASDRSGGSGGMDIYRATRASTSSPFSMPERVSALNSNADDFDAQLTADSTEVFFASTRNTGTYRLWRSLVTCP
jgi:hypothetical protein